MDKENKIMNNTQNAVDTFVSVGLQYSDAVFLATRGITEISQLLELTEESLLKFSGLGITKATRILSVSRDYKEKNNPIELSYEEVISNDEYNSYFEKYVKQKGIDIYDAPVLSTLSINTLIDNGIRDLGDFFDMNTNDFVKNEGKDAVEILKEIESSIKYIFNSEKKEILSFIKSGNISEPVKSDPKDANSLMVWIKENNYKEKLEEFFWKYDRKIELGLLSPRALHGLQRAGIETYSSLCTYREIDLYSIKSMGKATVQECLKLRDEFLNQNLEDIIRFCKGEKIVISYERFLDKTLELRRKKDFCDIGELACFAGIEYGVAAEYIGRMKKEGYVKTNKEMVYFIYPKFADCVKYLEDVRTTEIINLRLSGKTLEETAEVYGLTRERVRQIEARAVDKIKAIIEKKYRKIKFYENEFEYFYKTYKFTKQEYIDCFGISEESYNAIKMLFSSKAKDGVLIDENTIDDQNISDELRKKIEKFYNKNFLVIRGKRIALTKRGLREYVVRHFGKNEIKIEDFANVYNEFLKNHNITDENLYVEMTDNGIRDIGARLADSSLVLWKQWGTLRYYDIQSKDYTDLLDELDLLAYENIQISSDKLVKEHKRICKKFDIRDGYEMHNLLKKIVSDENLYEKYKEYFGIQEKNHITFTKMPTIQFGDFNREKEVRELLKEVAPIDSTEFAQILSEKYGYDEKTIKANWLNCIKEYAVQDGTHIQYVIDAPIMNEETKRMFKELLTEDFYTFDELRTLYQEKIQHGDVEEVNAYNMKQIGFAVYSDYVISSKYKDATSYFNSYLDKNDVIDAEELARKFGKYPTFTNVLLEAQYNFDIFRFMPKKFVSYKKLNSAGLTKEEIYHFIDDVMNAVSDDEIFNAKTLREKHAMNIKLDRFGMEDDTFINKILFFSKKFSGSTCFGTTLLKKDKGEELTRETFIKSQVNKYESIHINDFMLNVDEYYGTKTDKEDIVRNLGDEVYYDRIMQKLYSNYDLFLKDIEEE